MTMYPASGSRPGIPAVTGGTSLHTPSNGTDGGTGAVIDAAPFVNPLPFYGEELPFSETDVTVQTCG